MECKRNGTTSETMATCPLQFQPPTAALNTDSTHTVKSVILTGHGGIHKIKVDEAPIPVDVEEDHIEVEVHYCGMNFMDNYLRLGIIRSNNFPVIMGSECTGIVKRVGNEVTEFKVGDKVLCLRLQGGLFRHVVHVQKKYCFQIPDNIDLCRAVCLGLNFLVAYLCLFDLGNLKTTQIVFMQSIGGGVGTSLVQLARTVPLVRILGTASGLKHDQMRNLGANRIFLHSENYVERVLKLYPEGVDIVINCNGGSDVDKCLKMLRPCGKLINIGSNNSATYPRNTASGLLRPSWDNKSVSYSDMMRNTYTIAGLNIGKLVETDRSRLDTILTEIFEHYSQRKILPRAHVVLPLEQVADGMTILCRRENYGKVVLAVNDSAAVLPPVEMAQTA